MNNYKGVMLCSRPNEPVRIAIEKPFCSRVEGAQLLGLNPVKKEMPTNYVQKKRVNQALQRHKDWLEIYKLKMNLKKEDEEELRQRKEDQFYKVKEIGERDRVRTKKMKEDFENVNQNINKILSDDHQNSPKNKLVRLTEKNLQRLDEQNQNQDYYQAAETNQQPKKPILKSNKKETQKPKWAYTEKELEKNEDKECDELLDFVNNLDYDQYINDLEVQSMVKAIKNRITDLQEKENWKENVISDIKNKKKKIKEQKVQDENDDVRSNANSAISEGRSVQSERTQQSIQSIKEKINNEKKGKSDWDNASNAENKQKATLEERIAKHVADEVLRNYKHLGAVHSNQSIRKLLEKEAQNHINKGNGDGPLITVVKENTMRRNEVDPNNLPYLHRNPAI